MFIKQKKECCMVKKINSSHSPSLPEGQPAASSEKKKKTSLNPHLASRIGTNIEKINLNSGEVTEVVLTKKMAKKFVVKKEKFEFVSANKMFNNL
jgi:hypothetical protein